MKKEEIFALIDEAQARGVPASIVVNLYVTQDAPETNAVLEITVAKALAHFEYDQNDKGFPIMMIYPSESIVEGRIKFFEGDTPEVDPTVIKADGEKRFYKLLGEFKDAEGNIIAEPLYLNAVTGTLTVT